jgi:hypothetical protein
VTETPLSDELRSIVMEARHLPRGVELDLLAVAIDVGRLEVRAARDHAAAVVARRGSQALCPECGSAGCPRAWAWPNRCTAE